MKHTLILTLVITVFALATFSCDGKREAVYSGASWGMSMQEVLSLYKTPPVENSNNKISWLETIKGSDIQMKVQYSFDSREGLRMIELKAKSNELSPSGEYQVEALENTLLGTIAFHLTDEAYDWSYVDWGDTITTIRDRVYTSSLYNARFILTRRNGLLSSNEISATTILLPPERIWSSLPSQVRTEYTNALENKKKTRDRGKNPRVQGANR
jgi:hypothetical protein